MCILVIMREQMCSLVCAREGWFSAGVRFLVFLCSRYLCIIVCVWAFSYEVDISCSVVRVFLVFCVFWRDKLRVHGVPI